MIVGLGIDLVEISRIEKVIARQPRFLARLLTEQERESVKKPGRVAGRWAAKEAVVKAVGLNLSFHQIEILNDPLGNPTVEVNHPHFDRGRLRITISITHERTHAAAVAIVEKRFVKV